MHINELRENWLLLAFEPIFLLRTPFSHFIDGRESFSFDHFWPDSGIFLKPGFYLSAGENNIENNIENNSNVLVVVGKQYNCDGGGKEKWKDGGSGGGGKIIGGGVT